MKSSGSINLSPFDILFENELLCQVGMHPRICNGILIVRLLPLVILSASHESFFAVLLLTTK
jgi:hypothetical protein